MRIASRTLGWLLGLVALHVCGNSLAANYALLVGVNHCKGFKDPVTGQPYAALRGAENDADDFQRLLQKVYGFPEENIRLLKGGPSEATPRADYTAVKAEFLAFQTARGLTADDQFVFYFAGHGTQLPDARPFAPRWDRELDGHDEALCLVDAVNPRLAARAAGQQFIRGDDHHLIVDDELQKWLELIPANRITVVLDCCHSGDGAKAVGNAHIQERGIPPAFGSLVREKSLWADLQPNHKGLGKTITAVYACRSHEKAIERRFGDQQRGQFTKFLVDHLSDGRADAGLAGLLAEVTETMHREAGRLRYKADQEKARAQNPSLEPAGCNLPLVARVAAGAERKEAAPPGN